MPGSVYVADPYENPFNSLLALYIVVDDLKTGIVVKLAGEVSRTRARAGLSHLRRQPPASLRELQAEILQSGAHGGPCGPPRSAAITPRPPR